MRLATGVRLNGKPVTCWTLILRSFSPFETSKALAPGLSRMSVSGTEHVLVEIKVFKGFLGAAVRFLRRFGSADEGILVVAKSQNTWKCRERL